MKKKKKKKKQKKKKRNLPSALPNVGLCFPVPTPPHPKAESSNRGGTENCYQLWYGRIRFVWVDEWCGYVATQHPHRHP